MDSVAPSDRVCASLSVRRLMERVADADSSVRQALQALLRDRMCPLVAPGQLRPFMPLIMAHVAG